MKITLNAGHCPNLDSGAVSKNGLQEAEVVYAISQMVCYYLKSAGYEVNFVCENELYQITDASNNFNSDLFVSIHCNSAENETAQGTEVFCFSEFNESGKLARCIQKQIIDNLGTVDRGVKTANFYVLKNTNCPAVLVETAFLSNAEDEEILASDKGKDDFARAIAKGISDYFA